MAGDGVKHFVEARHSMSDEEYENYMRGLIEAAAAKELGKAAI